MILPSGVSVLWRVRQADGRIASARLFPAGRRARLVWYADHREVGSEEFDSVESAMDRAEELRVLVRIGGAR